MPEPTDNPVINLRNNIAHHLLELEQWNTTAADEIFDWITGEDKKDA